jgi:hypothetical protein
MRKKGRRKKGLVKGETFSLPSVGRFGLHSLFLRVQPHAFE